MSDTASLKALISETATYREILQQPDVWREAAQTIRKSRAALDAFLAPSLARENLRIVLTGAGTSAFIGQIAAPSLGSRLSRRVEAVATTDLVSHPEAHLPQDVPTLLVSFARSGDSPESKAATDLADQLLGEVRHLIITCNADGALNRAHEPREDSFVLLMPERSNDTGFAMTSSFTSMLLAVLLALGGDDESAVDALAAAAEALLEQQDSIARLAATVPQRVVFLGGGPLTGLARESALKMLELTAGQVVAYHDSSLGFRHGPKAVLDAHSLAVVYESAGSYSRAYDDDIVQELRASVGQDRVLTVSAGRADARVTAESHWTLPGLAEVNDDALHAVAFVVFAQFFALCCSAALQLTPDNPFPNGDVNRVVKGVIIHSLNNAASPVAALDGRR
ncbi:SIS domain-containing protein [Actinospica robiniae]|uniref:SIS domain-containing protein n=1 Tax=Actinospica robiniae TaxID=304901 RepID=UPI000413A99B|nr:SIS domain-containing protein [Actinospica robiniae]